MVKLWSNTFKRFYYKQAKCCTKVYQPCLCCGTVQGQLLSHNHLHSCWLSAKSKMPRDKRLNMFAITVRNCTYRFLSRYESPCKVPQVLLLHFLMHQNNFYHKQLYLFFKSLFIPNGNWILFYKCLPKYFLLNIYKGIMVDENQMLKMKW